MKKLVMFFLMSCLMFSMVTNIMANGSITCNKQVITVDEYKEEVFTITADEAAGRVDIKVIDETIANVDIAKQWLDKSSVDVTVTGLKAGKTTIVVSLTDISDYDGNELTGEIVIDLTVNGKQAPVEEKTATNGIGLVAAGVAVAATATGAVVLSKRKKEK